MTYGRYSGKSVNRMTPKTLVGSRKLGEKIRARWLELDLTIEEVALRAGIGTKRGAVTKPENPFGWISEGDLQGAELAGYGGSERGGGGSVPSSEAKRARNVAGIFERTVRDAGGGNVCYGQLEVS